MAQFMISLAGVLVLAALAWGIAALLLGRDSGLEPAEPDGRAVPLPAARPLTETDLGQLRFDTAPRGYRMLQVDSALRRAAYDIGYKEELIGVLEAEVTALREGRLDEAEALRQAREAASRPQVPPAEPDLADVDEAHPAVEPLLLGTFAVGPGPVVGVMPGMDPHADPVPDPEPAPSPEKIDEPDSVPDPEPAPDPEKIDEPGRVAAPDNAPSASTPAEPDDTVDTDLTPPTAARADAAGTTSPADPSGGAATVSAAGPTGGPATASQADPTGGAGRAEARPRKTAAKSTAAKTEAPAAKAEAVPADGER